ncbi:protein disulfide isomerase [Martiniozyma asiatica (nom. inval.)]|nr:protein disulfide isomerase [Martiniozyma asiatica]
MKFSIKAVCSILASIAHFAKAEEAFADPNSAVVKLTEETFEEFITSNPLVLAEFFAPWCGHCKKLAPEFSAASDVLAEKDINAKLAQIDCTEEKDLCSKFQIRGYPTLKVFKGELEEPADYQGQRQSDAIVSYMTKLTLPAVQVVNETADLDDTLAEISDVIILQVVPESVVDHAANTSFYELADKFRDDFTFISTSASEYVEKYAIVKGQPGYVVFRAGEIDEPSVFSGEELDNEHLIKFFEIETKPLFGEMNGATYQSYMNSETPLAYYFYNEASEREAAQSIIAKLGKENRGDINFVGLDATQFGLHAQNLNMKEEFPLFVIHDIVNNKKYGIDQSELLDNKAIPDFVAKFKAGELEPIVKSEPVPENPYEDGPVYHLVGTEHDSIIKSDKDVLVKYYAPWCGHCKRLAPIFEELSDMFKGSDDVVIADIDNTLNDVEGVEIEGYPTIVLFPADGSEPVYYEGSRTIESFVEFIKEKGSKGIDAFELEDSAVTETGAPVKTEGSEAEAHDEL